MQRVAQFVAHRCEEIRPSFSLRNGLVAKLGDRIRHLPLGRHVARGRHNPVQVGIVQHISHSHLNCLDDPICTLHSKIRGEWVFGLAKELVTQIQQDRQVFGDYHVEN